jgi:octaprenyl-diphosphate synthase
MTFMVSDLFGVSHETVAPFARMIELVHASTLAHDDVVDEAETRRGAPSINAVASNKKAVLAGDYLLAYVLQTIAAYQRSDLLSEMAGIIADLAEGEWIQMENSVHPALDWEAVETVARRKTGSVLRWCCVAPAMLAQAPEPLLAKARRLGDAIGIAFQLTDDILDFKRTDGAEGADLKNRVINSVIFESLSEHLQSPTLDMSQLELVAPPGGWDKGITKVRAKVDVLVQEADQLLTEIAAFAESERGVRNDVALTSLRFMVRYLAQRI